MGTLTGDFLCSGGKTISLFLECNLENIVQQISHCSSPPPAHRALRVSVHMQQQALVVKIERGFLSCLSTLVLTCYAAANHNYLQRYFCMFVIFQVPNWHSSVVRVSRAIGQGFKGE